MLSTNTRKIQYTTGNDFSLTGGDYIGYFNIFEKNIYASKYEQNVQLSSKGTTNSQIILSDNYFDRAAADVLKVRNLPEKIYFQPNEIINKNSINQKLELLYENFLDIYNFTKMASPDLPQDLTNFVFITGYSAGGVDIYEEKIVTGGSTVLSADLSSFSFSKINAAFNSPGKIVNTIRTRFDDKYTLFLSVSNTIFSYEIYDDNTTFTFINSADALGGTNELYFNDIVDVDHDDLSTLYIADSGNRSIYQVDVSQITFLDRTGLRNFNLKKIIGGSGTSVTNFNQIKTISVHGDNLFVYDIGDKVIKNFNKNLVFKKKYKNDKYFNGRNIVNIAIDFVDNCIYILDDSFNVLVLDVNNFTFKDEYKFESSYFKTDEKSLKIVFSENDSSIYYLLTDQGLYKYFKHSKTKLIGKYNFFGRNYTDSKTWDTTFTDWDLMTGPTVETIWDGKVPGLGDGTLRSVDLLGSGKNFDIITIFGLEKIITLKESGNYINFLDSDDLNFYKKSEILLKDEYFNSITFNTSLYKLLYNLKLLSIAINKRLTLRYLRNELYFERINNILADKSSLDLLDTKNFYIGNNENISVNNFNRCIKNMLQYQDNIIPLLDVFISNTKIPSLSTITF